MTGPNQTVNPGKSACNGIELKTPDRHRSGTRDKRSKGSYDRNETGKENRLSAVLDIKGMCFIEGLLVNPTDGAVIDFVPEPRADIKV